MGSTTETSLNADDGVGLAFVIAIEGYEYLVSDHDDIAAVITAWAATDWSECLPGLIPEVARSEEIEPWSAEIKSGSRVFKVKNLDTVVPAVAAVIGDDGYDDVVWTNKVNVTSSSDTYGSKITKTGGTTGVYDAGASSVAYLPNGTDGWVQFQTSNPTGTYNLCGLSDDDADQSSGDIAYGLYVRNNGSPGISVIENGSYKGGSEVKATTTEWLRVRRVGSTVTYERDDDTGTASTPGTWRTFYTSLVSSATDLYVDTSLEQASSFFTNVRMYNADDVVAAVAGVPLNLNRDRFGIDTHSDGRGTETYLTATRDPDDTSINAVDTTDFASSGTAYVGREAFSYTSTTGTLFTGSVNRGKFAPFQGNVSANWARYHTLPAVEGTSVQSRLKITDKPRTWIGRHIGLWAHEVNNGVLATKANAVLLFAGTIESIVDTTNRETALSCVDIRKSIAETVLHRDQFRGHIAQGVSLDALTEFTATSYEAGAYDNTTSLQVVTGASGEYQMEAGYWEVDALVSRLNQWFAYAASQTDLQANHWFMAIVPWTDGTYRTQLTVESSVEGTYTLGCPGRVPRFLGYDSNNEIGNLTGEGMIVTSSREPLRVEVHNNLSGTYNLDWSTGTWFNNRDYLPPELQEGAPSGENWGVITIDGGSPTMVKYSSDTVFTNANYSGTLEEAISERTIGSRNGRTYSQEGTIEVKQIVFLNGSLEDIMLKVLASTGATDYNHTTYDKLPHSLSCAVPWQLLAGATNSLSALAEATSRNAIMLILDKPTTFQEAFGAELLLRGAFLLWDNEGLIFAQLPSPNADLATHTLTEANKASPSGTIDTNRTSTETTDAYLRNIVVVHYNRAITGEYRDTITISHPSSMARYGERKVEIKARNAYGGWGGIPDVVESLTADLAAYTLAVFAEPFKIMHRSIDLNLFLAMAPGDLAAVTDSYARDPSTGIRGMTGKPALVLSTEYDMGGYKDVGQIDGMSGKVTLGFTPLDNVAVYAPAAMFDDTATNNGYQADTPTGGQSTLTFYSNTYSLNGETKDLLRFAALDEVSITQLDYDGGGTPLEWTGALVSVDAGGLTCVLDTNLASYDSAGYYRMTFANYTTALSTQKTKCFQADSGDGAIQDARVPYEFGAHNVHAGQAVDLTILPFRYSLSSARETGDGDALNPGFVYDLCAKANNLQSYKTAVSCPMVFGDTGYTGTTSATVWKHMTSFPVFTGQSQNGGGGLTRKLYIAPHWAHKGTGDAVSLRVSVTPWMPRTTGNTDIPFVGTRQQHTFTTTDTASYGATATAVAIPTTAGPAGLQFVTVEMLGNGTFAGILFGFPVLYLGPLE